MNWLSFALLGIVCAAQHAVAQSPPITALAISPAGNLVLLGSQQGVELRTWPELLAEGSLESALTNIHDLSFSPDGATLLIAGGSPAEEGVVEVWDWPQRKRTRRIVTHSDVIYRVAWTAGGDAFATASADGTCQVVEASTGRVRWTYAGHSRPVTSLAFFPDGKQVVSTGVDQTLQLWDASSGELLRKFDNHLAAIHDVVLRPAADRGALPLVATASEDRTVRFWQPTIGRMVRFAKLDSPPRAIAWSKDGGQLFAGCSDGRLWSIDPDTAETSPLESRFAGRIHALTIATATEGVVAGEGDKAQVFRLPATE